MQNRNSDDEFFIKSISKGVNGRNELIIMSGRAQSEKEVSEIGFEQNQYYQNTRILHYHLTQTSKVGESFLKLWESSMHYSTSKKQGKFLSKLEKSKWLTLIESLIRNSFTV